MVQHGTWQPDPDSPDCLRWRTHDGEWTDFIVTRHTASPAEPAPSRQPKKRRRRWLVAAILVVLGIGVVGVLVDQTGDTSSSPGPTEPVSVAESDSPILDPVTAPDEASDLIVRCGQLGERIVLLTTRDIPDAVARFDAAADRSDIDVMQFAYDYLGSTMGVLRATVASMEAAGCPGLFPEAWADVVEGQIEMEANWAIAQQICREDLAVLGFDC